MSYNPHLEMLTCQPEPDISRNIRECFLTATLPLPHVNHGHHDHNVMRVDQFLALPYLGMPGSASSPTEWRASASSTQSNNTSNAWIVNLSNGNTNNNDKTNTNQVACVR